MRAELAKLQRAEKVKQQREADKKASEDRLAAVEAKLVEKPPTEYKKSTNFMRWRDKEDK
jgi:hypothetical protein